MSRALLPLSLGGRRVVEGGYPPALRRVRVGPDLRGEDVTFCAYLCTHGCGIPICVVKTLRSVPTFEHMAVASPPPPLPPPPPHAQVNSREVRSRTIAELGTNPRYRCRRLFRVWEVLSRLLLASALEGGGHRVSMRAHSDLNFYNTSPGIPQLAKK